MKFIFSHPPIPGFQGTHSFRYAIFSLFDIVYMIFTCVILYISRAGHLHGAAMSSTDGPPLKVISATSSTDHRTEDHHGNALYGPPDHTVDVESSMPALLGTKGQ